MLIIKYNRKGIYINFNVLKANLKKILVNTFKTLSIICGILGVLFTIGTIGASDLGDINASQMVLRLFFSLMLCGISYTLCFVKNALQ